MEKNIADINIVNGKLFIDGQCVEIQLNTTEELNNNESVENIVNSYEIIDNTSDTPICDNISNASLKSQSEEEKLHQILTQFRLLEVLPNLKGKIFNLCSIFVVFVPYNLSGKGATLVLCVSV